MLRTIASWAVLLAVLFENKCVSVGNDENLDWKIENLTDVGGEITLQDEGPYQIKSIHHFKATKLLVLGNGSKNSIIAVHNDGQIIMEGNSSLLIFKKITFKFEYSEGKVTTGAVFSTKAVLSTKFEQCHFTGSLRGRSLLVGEDSKSVTILEAIFYNFFFIAEKWDCPLIYLFGGLFNLTSSVFANSSITNSPVILLENPGSSVLPFDAPALFFSNVTLNAVNHTVSFASEAWTGLIVSTLKNLNFKLESCYFLQNNFDTILFFLMNSGPSTISNCFLKENKALSLFIISNITILEIKGVNLKLNSPPKESTAAIPLKLSGCFLMLDGFQSLTISDSLFQDGELIENSLFNIVNTFKPKESFVEMIIKNSKFSKMRSFFFKNTSFVGTFLHIRSTYPLNLSVVNSYFYEAELNNSVPLSSLGGPVLFVYSERAVTKISGCYFLRNLANLGASCIQYAGEVLSLEMCRFYRNGDINFLLRKSYGPVSAVAFLLTVSSSEFIETRDEIQCGVTLMKSRLFMAHQSLIINSTNFLNNSCDRNYDGGMVSLDSSIFFVSLTMENSNLKWCDTYFGAVFLKSKYHAEVSFYNVSFYNLTCYRGGCAISYDLKEGVLLLTNMNFTLIKADAPTSGGGVMLCYIDEMNTRNSGLKIYNSTFKDITVNTLGGALHMIGGSLFVKNTSFVYSQAYWGGILSAAYIIAEFENCLFYSNLGLELASTFLLRDKVDLRVDNSLFNENYSPKGGTIACQSSAMNISNCVFLNNKGTHPALFELSLASEKSFMQNISVSFSRNTTYIFILFKAELELRSCSFHDNFANLIKATGSLIILIKIKVQNSNCFEKGCIANLEQSNVTVINSDMFEVRSSNLINMYFLVESFLIHLNTIFMNVVSTRKGAIDFADAEVSNILFFQCVFSDFHSKGISLKNSVINITACTITNDANDNLISNFIRSSNSNMTLLDNLVFNFISLGQDGSTFVLNFDEWTWAYIEGNHFENISNKDIGLFHITNGNVSLLANTFKENRAGKGSCIYYACSDPHITFCLALIKFNYFFRNKGKTGSLIFWKIKKPLIHQNRVEGNKADFGLGTSSEKFKLAFNIIDLKTNQMLYNSYVDVFPNNKYVVENVRNGEKVKIRIEFYFIDFEGQKLMIEEEIVLISDLTPSPYSESKTIENDIKEIQGRKIPRLYNDTFVFEEIVLVGNLTKTYDLVFSVSPEFRINRDLLAHTVPSYHDFVTPEGYYRVLIPFKFSKCSVGESYDHLSKRCEPCLPGQYSFNTNASCSLCQEGMICTGGAQVETKEKYWRSSKTSEIVYKCLGDGSQCGLFEKCSNGYKGPLCSLCDEAEAKGYFRFGFDSKCYDCGKIFWILIIFLPIVLMIHILFYRTFAYFSGLSPEAIYIFRSIAVHFSSSFLLSEIVWSDSPEFLYFYSLFWNTLSNFYTMGVIDCFVNFDPILKSVLFQLIPYNILSLFYILLFFKKKKMKNIGVTTYVSYFMNIYLFFYPSLIHTVFRSLSCSYIDDQYLSSINLSQPCLQGSHKLFLSFTIMTISIFFIGLPFYYYRRISKLRLFQVYPDSNFKLSAVQVIHGYITSPYSQKHFYWEFANFGFNLVLFSYYGFYFIDPGATATFTIAVYLIQYIVENMLGVFKSEFFAKIQRARLLSSIGVMLSQQIGIINQNKIIVIYAGALIILNHLGFYFYLFFVLREDYNIKTKNILRRKSKAGTIVDELKILIATPLIQGKAALRLIRVKKK